MVKYNLPYWQDMIKRALRRVCRLLKNNSLLFLSQIWMRSIWVEDWQGQPDLGSFLRPRRERAVYL